MPKTLTGAAGTFPSQTAPLASEPRTSGSVEALAQNAADRTQYLYDRLLYVDPTRAGARRLRRFETEAALKASTDYQDGTVAVLKGKGLYEYIATAIDTPVSPRVLQPDDNAGAGRWRLVMLDLIGGANGLAQLNGSGKVATTDLEAASGGLKIAQGSIAMGRVADLIADAQALSASIAPNTTQAIADLTLEFASVQLGDRLVYQATIESYAATTDYVSFRVKRTDPAAGVVYSGRMQFHASDAREQRKLHPLMMVHQAALAGLYKFEVQIETHVTNASNVACTLGYARLEVLRP